MIIPFLFTILGVSIQRTFKCSNSPSSLPKSNMTQRKSFWYRTDVTGQREFDNCETSGLRAVLSRNRLSISGKWKRYVCSCTRQISLLCWPSCYFLFSCSFVHTESCSVVILTILELIGKVKWPPNSARFPKHPNRL